MSILVNSDDRVGDFDLAKEWLVGRAILMNEDNHALNRIFDMDGSVGQVELIHSLSQQLILKPNRMCLSDAYRTIDRVGHRASRSLAGSRKETFRCLIPSQSILFELAQAKPDNTNWAAALPEDEVSASAGHGPM